MLEVPLELSTILTPGGSVSYGRTVKPSPVPLTVVPESPGRPPRGLTPCKHPSTDSPPTPTWGRTSTEDPGVLEVPLELSPILTPGISVPYGRTDKPSPAQRAVVPESPATPLRGNVPHSGYIVHAVTPRSTTTCQRPRPHAAHKLAHGSPHVSD